MRKDTFLRPFLFLLLLFNLELFAVSETQIKAVFLEKFTHLIQWPQEQESNFLVCVVNDKKFAHALQEIYRTKKFNNRTVIVKNIKMSEQIPSCQLLYLGSRTKHVETLLKSIATKPILTVSDEKKFVDKNVMITIFLKKKRFKYIINNKAAKEADMKISYLLLQSAQEVIQ